MVKLALIGYGYWGPNLLRNFCEVPSSEILYVCDVDLMKLKGVRKRYPSIILTTNFQDILEDDEIDGVIIATPTRYHFSLAKKALNAGKNILIEKPMTLSLNESRELVDLAKKNKKILMVDHTFLFTEAVRKLKKVIDSGTLGEIVYIDSVRVNLGLFQKDSNVIYDLATHDISILKYLLERDPQSVSAVGEKHFGSQEEIAYLHLGYSDGVTAHLHVSWLSPLKIRRMMIVGTKKMVVYDDVESSEKIKIYDKGVLVDKQQVRIGYRSGDLIAPNLNIKEALGVLASEFVESIEKNKEPLSSGKFGLSVVNILEKATISARTGKKILLKNAGSKKRKIR